MGIPLYQAVIALFLDGICFAVGIFGATRFYSKNKTLAIVALICALIVLAIWAFLMGTAFMLISEFLLRLSIIFYALGGFFAVLFVDLIWRQRPSAWRMSLITVLCGLVFVFSWLPDSVITSDIGEYSIPRTIGLFDLLVLLNLAVSLGIGFHWLVASALRAPRSTKRAARGLLLAAFLMGPCIVLADILIDFVIALAFSLLTIVVLGTYVIRHPQLLYILPFRVYRLLVIDADSGISHFHYDWTESEIDNVLLGGLLQGLQTISTEIMKRGAIQEVRLDNGFLLLHKEKRIFVGLLASQSSRFLEESLKNFAVAFEAEYCTGGGPLPSDIGYYAPAVKFIKHFFANIPEDRITEMN